MAAPPKTTLKTRGEMSVHSMLSQVVLASDRYRSQQYQPLCHPPNGSGCQENEDWFEGGAKTWATIEDHVFSYDQRYHKIDKQQFAPSPPGNHQTERRQYKNGNWELLHHRFNKLRWALVGKALRGKVCFFCVWLPHTDEMQPK